MTPLSRGRDKPATLCQLTRTILTRPELQCAVNRPSSYATIHFHTPTNEGSLVTHARET